MFYCNVFYEINQTSYYFAYLLIAYSFLSLRKHKQPLQTPRQSVGCVSKYRWALKVFALHADLTLITVKHANVLTMLNA